MKIRHGCAVMTEPALPCCSPCNWASLPCCVSGTFERGTRMLIRSPSRYRVQTSLLTTMRFVRQRDRYRTVMSLIHIGHFVGDDIVSAEVSISAVLCNADDIPCHRKSRTLYLQGHPSTTFVRSGWSIKTREKTDIFDTGRYYIAFDNDRSRVSSVTSVVSFRLAAIEGKTRTRHSIAWRQPATAYDEQAQSYFLAGHCEYQSPSQ
jgi:hypothetical protein